MEGLAAQLGDVTESSISSELQQADALLDEPGNGEAQIEPETAETETELEPEYETEPELETETEPEAELSPSDEERLRRLGMTQKSVEDLVADFKRQTTQVEGWNWAMKNIPGFKELMFNAMQKAKGHQVDGPTTPAELAHYDQAKVGEFRQFFKALMSDPSFRQELGIETRQEREAQSAEASARKTITDFSKSKAKDLSAMKLTWDQVEPELDKIISLEWGINDPAKITPKLLADAYNVYLMGQPGGMERIISNAKQSVLAEQERKRKLGKVIQPGSSRTGTPAGISDAASFAKLSVEDQEKWFEAQIKRLAG